MSHLARWMVGLAALAVVLTGCRQDDPQAQYAKLLQTYQQAQGLASEATVRITITPTRDGEKPSEMRVTTRLARPAKVFSQSRSANGKFDSSAASDGQVVRQRISHHSSPALLEAPAPADLAALLAPDGPMIAGAMDGSNGLTTEVGLFAGLLQPAAETKVTSGDSAETVGGAPCQTLTVTPPEAPPHRLWIGTADGLLRRVEFEVADRSGERVVQIRWEASQVALNPTFKPQDFTLSPAKGERQVAAATIGEATDHLRYGVGQPAPAFALKSVDGQRSVKLADLRGKVVLLDFWATWCGPCQKLQPALAAVAAKYGEKLALVMVSDETAAVVGPAVKERRLPGLQLLDPEGLTGRKYSVESLPTTFLIDRAGVLRQVHSGFDPNTDQVAKLSAWIDPLLAQ
ncbi:MAG: TlpA family protein disulfide reductase [Fimbriimonadaceae bacterium]|nr:TlpA family protein disulfide reductase [Fimbriimonadaceae bacterium]